MKRRRLARRVEQSGERAPRPRRSRCRGRRSPRARAVPVASRAARGNPRISPSVAGSSSAAALTDGVSERRCAGVSLERGILSFRVPVLPRKGDDRPGRAKRLRATAVLRRFKGERNGRCGLLGGTPFGASRCSRSRSACSWLRRPRARTPQASRCSAAATSQRHPFLRFLDPLPYTLAPDGGFEAGARGWKLSRRREGRLRQRTRSHCRAPAPGRSSSPRQQRRRARRCASDWSCRSSASPTERRRPPLDAEGRRGLDERVRTAERSIVLLPGVLLPSSRWVPTLPLLQLGGVLNALTLNGLTTQMSFRFTPQRGLLGSGTWQIDDVYVDPWKTV